MPAGKKAVLSRNPILVREQILDAAQAEFMEVGFTSGSTNRIVDRLGRSKPTVFRYFPSKEALFAAVVARIAARWSDQIHWHDIPIESPERWLREFGSRVLVWILHDENIFIGRMAVSERRAVPELVTIYSRLAVAPIQRVIATRLRAWTKAGQLECPHPRSAAESFLDLTISGLVSRRLYGALEVFSGDKASKHVDNAVGLFLRGTMPR